MEQNSWKKGLTNIHNFHRDFIYYSITNFYHTEILAWLQQAVWKRQQVRRFYLLYFLTEKWANSWCPLCIWWAHVVSSFLLIAMGHHVSLLWHGLTHLASAVLSSSLGLSPQQTIITHWLLCGSFKFLLPKGR